MDGNGGHLRFVPGELARAMVGSRTAEIAHQNGRVKSVRLVAAASSHARLIGPPSDGPWHSKFITREKLDSGHVVWKHHARSTYE